MKKYLIIFVIFFTSLFMIDNVNAQSYEFETDLFGTVTVDIDELISGKDLTGNFILTKNSNETTLEIIFESKDYELTFTGRFTNLSGTRYVNTYSSKYDSSTGSWKTPTATTYGITTNYNNIYYTNIDTIPVYNTSINMKYDENDGIYFEETDTSRGDLICVGTSGGGYLAYKNENTKLIEFYYNNSKTNSFSYESYPYYFLSSNNANYCQFYYSAEEFYYNTTTEYITANTTSYWIRPQTNSTEDDSSKITQDPVVYSSFDIYDENGNLYFGENLTKTPTILITKESEETVEVNNRTHVISVNLNIEFSNIDNDKYLYMYRLDNFSTENNDTWTTLTLTQSNSYQLNIDYNTTLYVQILNRETNEFVTSRTYTVTSILPYLEAIDETDDTCYITEDGVKKKVCAKIRIKPHIPPNHIADYDLFYSYDGTNWIETSTVIVQTMKQNGTLYAKVVDNTTNELIDTLTYTVISIEEVSTDPYAYFKSELNESTYIYSLDIFLYGYDKSKYKFYYRENNDDFVELDYVTLYKNEDYIHLKNHDILTQTFTREFTQNTTVYVKITDLNDNYINSYTYTVDYDSLIADKTTSDYMDGAKDFLNSIKKYIIQFVDIFTYFFNGLNQYIRNAIISIFVVYVAYRLVKMGRK